MTRKLYGVRRVSAYRFNKLKTRAEELNIYIPPGRYDKAKIVELRQYILDRFPDVDLISSQARDQAILSLVSTFESYVKNVISKSIDENISCLKSPKITLNDEELVEAIISDRVYQKLKSKRINEIMFGSVREVLSFLKERIALDFEINEKVIELCLVRNCLVHNKNRVSKTLAEHYPKYVFGKVIKISDLDFFDYKKELYNQVFAIRDAFNSKFPVKKLRVGGL